LSETQVALVWRRGIAALLLAASIVLVGFPESAAKYTGYDALSEHAMRLIDESLERDKKPFLVITAIKTALAVISGRRSISSSTAATADPTLATAISAASSTGYPYTPVEMAGNATDRAPTRSAWVRDSR